MVRTADPTHAHGKQKSGEMADSPEQSIDPSRMAYDDWIAFYFDRPIHFESSDAFGDDEFLLEPADPIQLVRHLTKLCGNLRPVIKHHGWGRAGQGLWRILFDAAYMWSDEPFEPHCFWSPVVPQPLREACIQSMYSVYDSVVQHIHPDIVMPNIFFMWWDIVANPFCESQGQWSRAVFCPVDPDARRTHDLILDVLERILNLGEQRCEEAALHGLGHLCHPEGARIVQQYLDQCRDDLTKEGIQWVETCRDGTVM